MKNIQVSVGIPTHEAGKSLHLVIDSIMKQTAWKSIKEVIVLIDGKKPNSKILKSINFPKVKVRVFSQQKGQSQRINDIANIATGDLLVLTNDDVYLKNDSVENFIKIYKKYKADLIAGISLPFSPTSMLENVLITGQKINLKITRNWNNGDNYLAVNGRLIALGRNYYKKLQIPKSLHNNDAFIYLNAKLNRKIFRRSVNSIAYYKTPTSLNEHFNQSVKFGVSQKETQQYFAQDISIFYKLPKFQTFKSFLEVMITNPISTISYIAVLYLSRLKSSFTSSLKHREGIWDTDHTTKNINSLINTI